jgi:hypothetical protein
MMLKLADLQNLLYRLITAPAGVEGGLAREATLKEHGIEAAIADDNRLSARDRLGIYANAYFYRLLDVFKEEFPCTHKVLGDINFHNLITGYLVECPPSQPSLLQAGHDLPRYLEATSGPPTEFTSQMPFVADLARLERACIEVFHGADADVLDEASLRALAPPTWPSIRIRLHPAAQILDVEWRIDALIAAIKDGLQWKPPERASVTMLVWRQGSQVRHRALEAGERAALKTAASRTDFGSICAAIATELGPTTDDTELASIINRMLAGWLRDGILACDND